MNNKEILNTVEMISNERSLPEAMIFEALEVALATAAKRHYDGEAELRVAIDRKTGSYKTFRRWHVVDDAELADGSREIALSAVQAKGSTAAVDEVYEEEIENAPFGRIAAQTAKQVMSQRIREAERLRVVEAYADRKGELVSGVVKRQDRGSVILDMGDNVEAILLKEDLIPRELVTMNQRLRGYLMDVRYEAKGPQLFISRTCPEFLMELFRLEVPEISQGSIELKGAARDPGVRAKIAVKSNDQRIDPVGSCVGMRGARVQSVSRELGEERIDIVLWDANPAQFVINAMAPAEVVSIIVDEDAHGMDVAVSEEKYSQAIGRGGQNVRLASQLTGWSLNVLTESQAAAKTDQESTRLQQLFVNALGIDEELAAVLVREGFTSLEEVAYVPIHEMLEVAELTAELVDELRHRARDALVTQAIAQEEQIEEGDGGEPAQDLLTMSGMDEELAYLLAGQGICTMEELAELARDDLVEIAQITPERASELIMTARIPWFAADGQ